MATLIEVFNEIAMSLQTKLNTTNKFKPINFSAGILDIGSNATASASDIRLGKTAYVMDDYVNGTLETGAYVLQPSDVDIDADLVKTFDGSNSKPYIDKLVVQATLLSSLRPTLNAPSVSISYDTLTITNPASNGSFVTSYSILADNRIVSTTVNNAVDLNTLSLTDGTYSISARCNGTGFNSSAVSSSVSWTKSSIPRLATVQNVGADGTIVSWDEVENATSYEILADDVSIGEVSE